MADPAYVETAKEAIEISRLAFTDPKFLGALFVTTLIGWGGIKAWYAREISNLKGDRESAKQETTSAKQHLAFVEAKLKDLQTSEAERLKDLPNQEAQERERAALLSVNKEMRSLLEDAMNGPVTITYNPLSPPPALTHFQLDTAAAISNTAASGVISVSPAGANYQITATDSGRRIFNYAGSQSGKGGASPQPTIIGGITNYGSHLPPGKSGNAS